MNFTRSFNLVFFFMLIAMVLVFFHISFKTQRNHVHTSSKTDISKKSIQAFPTIKYPLDFVYPYNYTFTLNEPDKCKHRDVFLVLLIMTRVTEFANRFAIRKTWGNESLVSNVSIVRLFLVGIPAHFTEPLQESLKEESMLFHDIIQQDFRDSYINLTMKTMMGLQWINTFCPNVSYILKIDGDIFLNTEHLVRFLNPEMPVKENYFTGNILENTVPFRDKDSKYYVPYELYKPDYYPPYCGGTAYVFSRDIAKKIYDIAHVIKPFNIEDAYVGVCLQKLGIKISRTQKSLFIEDPMTYAKCDFVKLITVHHFTPKQLLQIWPDFITAKSTCQSDEDS